MMNDDGNSLEWCKNKWMSKENVIYSKQKNVEYADLDIQNLF